MPSLLDAGVRGLNIVFAIDGPSWWVSDGGVDVFQGDGEVDDVEIEVVNAPIGELLAADFLIIRS